MKYFRDLRLRTKLGGSYALLVLLIALCTAISWAGQAKVDQHARATQRNAGASEKLAATAEAMSGRAEQLQGLMSFFKLTPAS